MPCNSIATVLASFFGAGCSRIAPGTAGSMAALPLVWSCALAGWALYSLFTIVVLVAGIWICDKAAKEIGVHDHGGIVWDEVAGMLVTMWFIPVTWQNLFIGFLLFRLFDIWKPWPIRMLDLKVHGGLGIMLDDLVAGLFANISLWLILIYIAG